MTSHIKRIQGGQLTPRAHARLSHRLRLANQGDKSQAPPMLRSMAVDVAAGLARHTSAPPPWWASNWVRLGGQKLRGGALCTWALADDTV